MKTLAIHGHVVSTEDKKPLGGLRVEAWDKDLLIDDLLGSAVTDAAGGFTIRFDRRYYKELVFDRRPDVFFKVYQGETLVADTSDRILWNSAMETTAMVIEVPAVAPGHGGGGQHGGGEEEGKEPFEVRGLVVDDRRVAARGVRVDALDHNLDGTTLLGSASTDDAGRYSIRYRLQGKQRADLQVRVLDVTSAVIYDARPLETVDVVVPAGDVPRATEYERLLRAVQPHLKTTALDRLTPEAVSYVANKSGWDPRAVAMAAQAARLAGSTQIPAAHYYALFRSGAAGDDTSLSRLSTAYVEQALRSALESKVIPADAGIDASVAAIREQSAPLLMTVKPTGAVSSLGEMLDVRLEAAQKPKFVELYQTHGHEPEALWSSLAENGFAPETIAALQTDGKLGYLTRHNAPLVARLRQSVEIADAADLPRAGLYKAEAWTQLIGDNVPEGITAEAYAAGLAAQVNLSFPTLVTAEMVRRNEVSLPADSAPEVARFLGEHPAHTIGVEPVNTWAGYAQLSPAGQTGAQLVERMYQISPSNESMAALSRFGLHSAYQVVSHSPETFLTRFGEGFPSQEEARLVYAKAQEVHSTALGVATTYLTTRSAPNLYALTGSLQKTLPDWVSGGDDDAEPVPGAPTLEELFDNMDYCACDHCKSVLSPAAYLVELLQFIDLDPSALQGGQNPINVLRGRRPDIERLLLSCENTNVALPYVDLVNEVLEFYVVQDGIATFTGHDTAEDSVSADLLADPQFVEDKAYDETKAAVYPWSLPFDMPLAAMRLILQTCGTSLAESLRLLGDSAGARRELLGLNAGEYSILTDVTFRDLPLYFGLPATTTIGALNDAIADGKSFSRTTGISYEELVAILKTEFINPGVVLIPLLTKLGVGLDQIQSWFDGGLTDAQLQALLPGDLDAAEFDGDVLNWLTANRELIMGLITLTDVGDPDEPDECNFAEVELRFALPDMTANRLTAIAYHKLLRFIRLWKKLGWSIELTDRVVTTFLPTPSQDLTAANIDVAFTGLLARIANFKRLLEALSVSSKKIDAWLAVWDTAAGLAVRQERLAGLLRIGITDMVDLAEISGIDPLAGDMESDAPSLLRFIERWQELKTAGLKVVDLSYLLRHHDAGGKLTPTETSLLRGLKALRDGLTAVEAEVSIAPGNADFAFAKAKMALVYDQAVVNWFFSLIGDTTTYSVPLVMAEEVLPAPLTAVDARLTYDPFKKLLGFSGIVTAALQTALETAADDLDLGDMAVITTQANLDAFVAAFKAAVQALVDAGDDDLQKLNSEYPELEVVFDAVQAAADPASKAAALIDGILPSLRQKLQTLSLRGTLAALLQSDPAVVDALTSDPAVLHAEGDATRGVLTDFERLRTAVALDANQTYRFYVDPPATDDYMLYVAAPAGTTVTLTLGGTAVLPATVVGTGGEVKTNLPVALAAGALTLAELTLAGLPAGQTAELRWRTKGMAKTAVPGARVYAEAQVITARASLIRLQKAALLRRLLALTPRELVYFAGTNPETVDVLNDLDTDGSIAGPDLQALWDRVALLVWFAGLKQENEPEENTWVSILEDPGLTTAQGDLLILGVNGWKAADLTAVLGHLSLAQTDLSQLSNLRTVKRVMDWVVAADYPAADLLDWASAAPDAALLAAAKAAIRARLQDTPWRETMRSVNDALRNQRRDALVSYILHHQKPAAGIDTADQLYEHFLIDVQMDACMLTSRIRAALSAVQLFITRCFMNLEPAVTPAALRADRWAYMKRYRVWEANRKIFLYPENWLEPELRDNKSPFFRELEAELLKSDITDELAEDAYLSYLKKLDDVARLEIVGMTLEERQPGDQDDDVLHVFGRTNGDTRQHYYRRYEGGYWLPWEKVSLNIQGDHVLPVVWKKRLFVFWLNAVLKAQPAPDQTPEDMRDEKWTGKSLKTAEISLGWGEYFKGKWSSPKSSDTNDVLRLTDLVIFEPKKIVLATRTEKPDPKVSERLIVSLLYMQEHHGQYFKVTFTSKNAPPVVEEHGFLQVLGGIEAFNYSLFWDPQLSGKLHSNSLNVPEKVFKVGIHQPPQATSKKVEHTLLTKTGLLHRGYHVRPLLQKVGNQWEAPFFYYDEHSTFFVSPDERVRMVHEYNGYYLEVATVKPREEVFIPPLYEVPVPDPIGPVIGPEDPLLDPMGPAIRLGEGLAGGINPRAFTVLPTSSQFNYGGAVIGAHGILKGAR